jgi:hyperosmotically inducible periplasmic protein
MANPLETFTKVVGFGIQQGTKILGGVISSVTGGGGDEAPQREDPVQKAASQRRASQQPKPLDDVTITRKVESEIFRGSKADKGKISVNTADGVVWLRGEVKNPEQVKELEAKTAAIPEVKRVENLLHLPKTPAPTRTKKASPAARKVTTGRTTGEKRGGTAAKEPSPSKLASTRTGRQPAPLGSDEPSGS